MKRVRAKLTAARKDLYPRAAMVNVDRPTVTMALASTVVIVVSRDAN